MTIQDLQRNDVPGAVTVFRHGVLAGDWDGDRTAVILQLQDDPTDLVKLLVDASKDPAVAAALSRLSPRE